MTTRTRPPRSRSAVLLVAVVAVLSACSGHGTGSTAGSSTGVPASPAQTSASAAGRVWKGVASACPNLSSAEAHRLAVAGPGTPTAGALQDPGAVVSDCHWGSTGGQAVALTVRMVVWRQPAAADAGWRLMRAGQTQPVQVGDEAFITDEIDGVAVRARSGNALATVRLAVPSGSAAAARLAELRTAAPAITRDVFADLVPG